MRSKVLLAGVAALTTLGALGACGVPTEDSARLEDDADVPFGLLDEATTTTPPATGVNPTGASLQICLLRDDELARVGRAAPATPALSDVVELLAAGPTPEELDGDITTALADDAVDPDVESAHGIAEVDLTGAFAADAGARQALAVAQIVCTLTSQPGIGQVTFTLDGDPVDVPRGDGSTTSDPVSLDDYRQLDHAAPAP
jgi:hypothetical protein